MPCRPEDLTISAPVVPGIPIPGFGIPFSPIQVQFPSGELPTEIIEDLLELIEQFSAAFPSGLFKPNVDLNMKTVLDFVANLLTQVAPFLSFYNFITAALNLFACIIEVLCAIPDPFAVAAKLRRLFTECLPPFLNLFPWIALIAMILALLLLILALIQYILQLILSIIERIIENISILAQGVTLQDSQSILAATAKIASGLCFIENLMAIFVAIAAIIAVINALASIAGFTICDDGDIDGCCPTQICPPFIKNNPDGILVTNGKLIYQKEIQADLDSLLSIPGLNDFLTVSPVRAERWQIYNKDSLESQIYKISDIIVPQPDPTNIFGEHIFWPESLVLAADASKRKSPYLVDLTIRNYNPIAANPSDTRGARTFVIKDCVVVRKPYLGTFNYFDKTLPTNLSNLSGTLNIEGGLVFEEDGITPYEIDGEQATLNNFIFQEASSATSVPTSDDSAYYDVEFTWKPNHGALAGYQLISVGCMPEVNVEKAVLNSIINAEGTQSVLQKIFPITLPNVQDTVNCVTNGVQKIRDNEVTLSALAEFQSTVQTCFADLTSQTTSAICALVTRGTSNFRSTISLSNDLEYASRPITATVVLKDPSGNSLSGNLPSECSSALADLLRGEVTLGNITEFVYNGTNAFTAQITTERPGDGILTVYFDNQILSTVRFATNTNETSSISPITLPYTFVSVPGPVTGEVRRDEGDIARLA